MFDICRKRERVSFTSVQQKIDHMSPVGSLTEREWQTVSYDPSSLIGYGHQNFIGMEKIGEI